MGLQSKVSALLQKSPGNVRTDAERIRSADNPNGKDIANAVVGLQTQLDAIKNALTQNPSLQELTVQDTDGSLIAWIGDRVVNGISYIGAYFRRIWIGGTGPADANIIADGTGISINGAAITLTKNGVTTTINNVSGISGETESLNSKDSVTPHGAYTAITPFSFYCYVWDAGSATYTPAATLRATASGEGRILLTSLLGNSVSLATGGGGGAPFVSAATLTHEAKLSGQSGLQFDSSTAIDISKNGTLASLTLTTPLATTSGGTGSNYANFAALVAAIESAFGGVSGSVTYVTGLSTSSTVIDYLDHSSNPQSATVLTGVSGTTSTIIFTNGIRTT